MTTPRTFTHPDVLAAAAAGESWADPETDSTPTMIYGGHLIEICPPTHDQHGNHVPIVYYRVTFTHDHGTGSLVLGGHDYPSSLADIDAAIIQRHGYRNPVATLWTPTGADAATALSLGNTGE